MGRSDERDAVGVVGNDVDLYPSCIYYPCSLVQGRKKRYWKLVLSSRASCRVLRPSEKVGAGSQLCKDFLLE